MDLTDNLGSIGVYVDSFEKESDAEKQGGLELEAFNPQLFRKHANLALSKLEKYLADSSIRGLALTDPSALLHVAKDLMTDENQEIASLIDILPSLKARDS
ncbi:MAG: hypothetical protein F6K58_31930 [Symploca sp. SIO2E9]|nr:hypothetical protein [Symploca sp. SIO2E9]